jgi:hypothetical protein
MMRVFTLTSASALILSFVAHWAGAQGLVPPPYAEYRVDAIDGRGATVQGGIGYTVPMGIYMRVAAIGAIGAQWRDGTTMLAGRTDVIARFLLDPFRQMPLALSFGGGVSVPYERGAVTRPYLTAVVDLEGRARKHLTPAVQVGLGGGARVGVVLRTSVLQRR